MTDETLGCQVKVDQVEHLENNDTVLHLPVIKVLLDLLSVYASLPLHPQVTRTDSSSQEMAREARSDGEEETRRSRKAEGERESHFPRTSYQQPSTFVPTGFVSTTYQLPTAYFQRKPSLREENLPITNFQRKQNLRKRTYQL